MLEILYRDRWLVAVNKPAGLLVHRTGLDVGETRFALQLLRDQLGQPVWPVHRLDKGTSGVLLFALDPGVASQLGQRFAAEGDLRKEYRAMVRGWPPDTGLIDHPLRREPDGQPGVQPLLQEARTEYRVLARLTLPLPYGAFPTTRCALLALHPLTGRRHQLRRHLKHLSHPILGDATHGKGALNRDLAGFLGLQRLWLHACRLELEHPQGGRVCVEAPLGPEWGLWPPPALKEEGPEGTQPPPPP